MQSECFERVHKTLNNGWVTYIDTSPHTNSSNKIRHVFLFLSRKFKVSLVYRTKIFESEVNEMIYVNNPKK